MSESTEAWVVAGVRAVIRTHTQAQDAGRTDDVVALYTPDAVLELPGMDPIEGTTRSGTPSSRGRRRSRSCIW